MEVVLSPSKFASYFLEIAKGNVPGHSAFSKFGENPDIDTASGFETIWDGGGVYAAPTVATLHDVVSTSTTDVGVLRGAAKLADSGTINSLFDADATFQTDGVVAGDFFLNDTKIEFGIVSAVPSEDTLIFAGSIRLPTSGMFGTPPESGDSYRVIGPGSTGASILFIQGLGATLQLQSEFVMLNGTTIVPTANLYSKMFRGRVLGSPPSTGAVGDVTATSQADATVSVQVLNGNNQTLMAVFTVPIDKNGFITRWWASLSKKQAGVSNVVLRAGQINGYGFISQNRSVTSTGSSTFDSIYTVPIVIGPGLDVWVEADAGSNDMGIASGFDIVLVDI